MNFPTQLTVLRMILSAVILFCLFQSFWVYKLTAFILYIVAVFTDALDGYIARKYNLISDLGKLLDPIADKLLVLSLLASFYWLQLIPLWVLVLIAIREIAVTSVRLQLTRSGVVIAAGKEGKMKTIVQMVSIGCILFYCFLSSVGSYTFLAGFLQVSVLALEIAVLLTVYSGIIFFKNNWSVIRGKS